MATKELQLQIIDVSAPVFTKTARGGYNSVELAYKLTSDKGQVEGKKLVDFNSKDVFEFFKTLKNGDNVTVVSEKGDADQFWKWTKAFHSGAEGTASATQPSGNATTSESASQAASGGSRPTGRVTGSNYETADERARKQVYIVRQSSVTNAVEIVKTQTAGDAIDPKQVIEVAKQLEAYVFSE